MRYSVLDLAPVPEGETTATALANSVDLARHAEDLGYHRFWLAEHHNMTGIASAATAILIGHVAGATRRIRVGSGGIMLPNHAPLMVAEQFGTLATLYPDRIDLGLGRAPGTDQATMRALRRGMQASDTFPQDVVELLAYLGDGAQSGIRAVPGKGTNVPVWILGSSLFGAQLAAHLGLPYAFASHFAPDALEAAAQVYRGRFEPSPYLDAPHFAMAINVFAGESDAEGTRLRTSMEQAFANLRRGQPGPLPRPVDDIEAVLEPHILHGVRHALSVSATGGPESVQRQLSRIVADHGPDEVILTGQIHDHAARRDSFRIGAAAVQAIGDRRASAA